MIRDYSKKEAFTVEEIIAAAIIFSTSVLVFKDITIASYSISYIFMAGLVIYIGFKYGTSFGAITGLALGANLTLIGNIQLFQIFILMASGILAGILAHIVMPRKFERESINSEILLGNSGERCLNYYEEIKEKINAVAQTISDMNHNFFIKNSNEAEILNKEVYIDNFLELIENYQENVFYEVFNDNVSIIGDIFEVIVKEDVITEKEMLDILKKYHNYVLYRDQKLRDDLQEIIRVANRTYRELQINSIKADVKKEEAERLENQLKNVTNIITNITKDEEEITKFENKEKEIKALLKGKMYPIKSVNVDMCKNGKYIVELKFNCKEDIIREKSKILNIETLISRCLDIKCTFQKDKITVTTGEYIQIYSSEDKFALQVGNSRISKEGNGKISGDSNLQIRLNDGKYLLAISDGMGSGEKARKSSKFVINNLNNLLSKGFEQQETINLINSELNFNKDDEMYATLDMSVLDLYTGEIVISKNGACNTYIKNRSGISVFKGANLPVGIVKEVGLEIQKAKINEGDIIVMCSDGLLEAKQDSENDWIESFLRKITTTNVQKIADLLTTEAIDNSYGTPKDDITVIVAKIINRK